MRSGIVVSRSFPVSAPTVAFLLIIVVWAVFPESAQSKLVVSSPARASAKPSDGRGFRSLHEASIATRRAQRSEVSPATLSQEAYLKASNTGTDDAFGWSIAISGDTAVVGAVNEASNATGVNGNATNNSAPFSGAAYVFVRVAGLWSQQAYLKPSNTGSGDSFGHAVAISGDTIVVGAPYEDSSATGVNGNGTNNASAESGAAYVFVRSGNVWSQQAYLKASNTGTGDRFGYSVAVSGDTVVVGADSEDSSATGVNGNGASNASAESGAAYIFVRSGTTWSQQAYVKASNTGSGDSFGWSVGISADTVVIGAPGEDSAATGINGDSANDAAESSGAAYVFVRSGTNWSQQAYVKASNTEANDFFGYSIAVSAETLVVGAVNEDSSATGVNGNAFDNSATDSGAAYVFTRSSGSWSQQAYLKASNTGANDFFGSAVAISGDLIVSGAPYEYSAATGVNGDGTDNSVPDAGAAYQFQRIGSVWSQRAYLKASNTETGDRFGYSVAVSTTVVVGAIGEGSSATGVNGNQSDNSATDSGAAYAFTEGAQQALSFSVAGSTIAAGSNGTASIVFYSRGDENRLAFSVNFDMTRLGYVSGAIGAGLPVGSSLAIDSGQSGSGRIGATITLPAGQSLAAGPHQLLTLTLNALGNAQLGATQLSFGDVPTARSVVQSNGNSIPIDLVTFNAGTVNIIAPIPARTVRVVGTTIQPGSTGSVSVEIDALGSENALAFSLTFETAKLSFSSASLGSGAPGASLNVNTSEVGAGRIGIRFDLPAGQALQSGTRLVVNVFLSASQGAALGTSPIGFGDSPVVRELVDVSGSPLPANYSGGTVTIDPTGFEADTSPRPNGNNVVSLIDWVQTGRFAVGLDTASVGSEFQRADCAPKETKGNGALSLADWVQAGRYGAGLDPVVSAGGPTAPTSFGDAPRSAAPTASLLKGDAAIIRSVSTASLHAARGEFAEVSVWLDATGAESAISFTLSFDQENWEFAGAAAGKDVSNATLIFKDASDGRVGIALALPPGNVVRSGMRCLVNVRLKVRNRNRVGSPAVQLNDDGLVRRELVDVFGETLPVRWVRSDGARRSKATGPVGER